MKTKFLTALLATTISLTSIAHAAEGGVGGPGGGNLSGITIKDFTNKLVDPYLSIGKSVLKSTSLENLAAFVKMHEYLKNKTKIGLQIEQLSKMGLSDEILKSKFDFNTKCTEQQTTSSGQIVEVETDASTLVGSRGAVICLNLRKLVAAYGESLTPYHLYALILHENARHFSSEVNFDKLEISVDGVVKTVHPLAMYLYFNSTRNPFGMGLVFNGGVTIGPNQVLFTTLSVDGTTIITALGSPMNYKFRNENGLYFLDLSDKNTNINFKSMYTGTKTYYYSSGLIEFNFLADPPEIVSYL